ncbi:transcriptional regulator with XRE-family HTH domain [Duganella sp. 1224]|uniref:helix-turn-helix transcriptional regulator n=1 Tax=Duganella sp. 1224 TaxID=2587052 RepID=UPI0015CC529D|nr:helix-turn-helix transcriptional regulator [Duganella sp. 1224]NYE61557.1 transcriptional regulator with XRE-family HTH domain [Duganella sp. 1224]
MNDLNPLGQFLRDRRTRLDPAAFGIPAGRRRTAGLRREEVAQRANISTTWYTWLEQGRGGAASAEVLDRIAAGLMLTEPEREHLFMLGLGRPPEARYKAPDAITPRLQRVLDAFRGSAAMLRTPTWDIVAWNRAATLLLTDYAQLAPKDRNVARLMFSNARVRALQSDWEHVARFVVGSLRADAIRAGAGHEVAALADELSRQSPEFAAMWADNEVISVSDGRKVLHHHALGPIALEFSTFAVDGRPDLSMMVYNPATPDSAARIAAYLAQ